MAVAAAKQLKFSNINHIKYCVDNENETKHYLELAVTKQNDNTILQFNSINLINSQYYILIDYYMHIYKNNKEIIHTIEENNDKRLAVNEFSGDVSNSVTCNELKILLYLD